MKKLLLPATLLLASGLAAVGTAHAATANSTLNVSATISSECIVLTTEANFGTVSASVWNYATGTVSVQCTLATPYTIALDAGANYDGTSRNVSNGLGNTLAYDLQESVSLQLWGDGGATNTWAAISGTGTGSLDTRLVEATLYFGTVPAGTYSDTVNVTVTY